MCRHVYVYEYDCFMFVHMCRYCICMYVMTMYGVLRIPSVSNCAIQIRFIIISIKLELSYVMRVLCARFHAYTYINTRVRVLQGFCICNASIMRSLSCLYIHEHTRTHIAGILTACGRSALPKVATWYSSRWHISSWKKTAVASMTDWSS